MLNIICVSTAVIPRPVSIWENCFQYNCVLFLEVTSDFVFYMKSASASLQRLTYRDLTFPKQTMKLFLYETLMKSYTVYDNTSSSIPVQNKKMVWSE